MNNNMRKGTRFERILQEAAAFRTLRDMFDELRVYKDDPPLKFREVPRVVDDSDGELASN